MKTISARYIESKESGLRRLIILSNDLNRDLVDSISRVSSTDTFGPLEKEGKVRSYHIGFLVASPDDATTVYERVKKFLTGFEFEEIVYP